jgi:hypothetical protein
MWTRPYKCEFGQTLSVAGTKIHLNLPFLLEELKRS